MAPATCTSVPSPAWMAVVVVVQLEVVDVDQDQRHRQAGAPAAAPFGIEALVEGAAVGHAGQGVGEDQGAQGVALALDGELGAHARAHDGGVHRLADEIGGAGAQRARLVLGRLQGGDEDHRDVGGLRVGQQFAAHGVAVHAGHDGVEQDQVGLLGAGDFERARAVHREQHLVLVLQRTVQDLDVFHRIVDHQDAAVHGHVGPAHASSSIPCPAVAHQRAAVSNAASPPRRPAPRLPAVSPAPAPGAGVELGDGFHVVIVEQIE
jgi:hypothetical protein